MFNIFKKRQCAAEVPHGEYEVKIEKMELTATKETRKPMVSIGFKIVAGDYKNSMIFMYQVITEGFQIHIVNEFLRDLATDTDVNVEFKTYNQYGNMIMDIKEVLDESGVEFALDYGENKQGYSVFKTIRAA